MLTFTKRQGSAGVEVVQVVTEDGKGGYTPLVDKYVGDEDLVCILWPGDDRSTTTTLAATWDDGPAGKVRVAFPADATAALDATWYSGLLSLASDSTALADFRLVVEAGPGTAAAPKTYHAYRDLLDELPWIATLADQMKDQSGFVEVAADARRWIDAAILRSVPDGGFLGLPWRGSWVGAYTGVYGALDQADDPTIAAALDADQLMLGTATGRRFVRASVYYTIAKVLRRAVGVKGDNDLLTLSKQYAADAERELYGSTAQIDVDGDGAPDYVFPLNRARLRRM